MDDALKSEKLARKVGIELAVTIDTLGNIANCEPVPFGSAGTGAFTVPAASALTTLNFYVTLDGGVTYLPLYTQANALITMTVAASRAYPLPPELQAFPMFKIVGNAAGTVGMSLKT